MTLRTQSAVISSVSLAAFWEQIVFTTGAVSVPLWCARASWRQLTLDLVLQGDHAAQVKFKEDHFFEQTLFIYITMQF